MNQRCIIRTAGHYASEIDGKMHRMMACTTIFMVYFMNKLLVCPSIYVHYYKHLRRIIGSSIMGGGQGAAKVAALGTAFGGGGTQK